MNKDELSNLYFEWICQLVFSKRRKSYRKLLMYLHTIEFTYILNMDSNRAEDGRDLRYRFGYERHYDKSIIRMYLDTQPSSVLEMMVALALRCEENIMDNPEIGNRLELWFWTMITNLGLDSMNDSKFDKTCTNGIIYRFLNRDYKQNGDGGLFILKHPPRDLRKAEIWYQACWYLDEFLAN